MSCCREGLTPKRRRHDDRRALPDGQLIRTRKFCTTSASGVCSRPPSCPRAFNDRGSVASRHQDVRKRRINCAIRFATIRTASTKTTTIETSRVSAGRQGGGQWTDGGSSAPSPAVAPVLDQPRSVTSGKLIYAIDPRHDFGQDDPVVQVAQLRGLTLPSPRPSVGGHFRRLPRTDKRKWSRQ